MTATRKRMFPRDARLGRDSRPGRALLFLWSLALLALQPGCSGKESATAPATSSAALTTVANVPRRGAAPWFEDATERLQLAFTHDAGPQPEGANYLMPQSMGSGCALFDFDNDGRLDIYLLHNGGPRGRANQLFRQNAAGRFEDVSAGSGLDIAGFGMGATAGDVNNDGLVDVVVTEYGATRLLLNSGGGKFVDCSAAAGIDNPGWGTSASFLDYDRDGWLDLVVANYVDYDPTKHCQDADGRYDYCSPQAFPASLTRLFRNTSGETPGAGAPHVRFVDVTVESGLSKRPGPGLGVICADFNRDRWPDILIADDGQPNRLWLNRQDGTFVESGLSAGLAYNRMGDAEANMGIAIGDVDGDGAFDVFITHLTHETPTLWKQGADGLFEDCTPQAGLSRTYWRGTGFGTAFADFDCDGDLDLAAVNGRVRRAPAPVGSKPSDDFWAAYAERNQLFANGGQGDFNDVSPDNAAFCREPGVGRALAVGDIDNDGAVDLVATYVAGPARVYKNIAAKRGHWLTVRALLPEQQRDAYGATIDVYAQGRRWTRYVLPAGSYLTSHDARAHFGLGDADQVDELRVVWPDGSEEVFAGGAVDRELVLRRGEGSVAGNRPAVADARRDDARNSAMEADVAETRELDAVVVALDAPPRVDMSGVDQAVKEAIAVRQARVREAMDSADAWGELGMVLMAHEFTPAAQQCFEQAERLGPDDARWPYYQGIALAAYDALDAMTKLARAAELDGDQNDAVRLRLAEMQLAEGLVDAALGNFRKTLERQPENARAWLGVAKAESRGGDEILAVAHARRALNDPRTRRAAAVLLAQLAARHGNPAGAETARAQVAKLPPDAAWPDALYQQVRELRTGRKSVLGRASQLVEQGKLNEALPLLQRAVEEQPEGAYGWTLLGVCRLKRGEPVLAEEALRRSLALEANSVIAQFHLGLALVAQDRFEEATERLRAAIVLKPDFALGHFQLAECRRRVEDRAGAIAAYRDAVRCQPNFLKGLVALAELLVEDGQWEAARPYVKRALVIDPRHVQAGELLRRLGADSAPVPPNR